MWIVDIDFKRALGVWSNLSGTPLAVLSDRFTMGEVFQKYERGEISDEDFAGKLCDEMGIALSFEQFATGWQAVFVALRPEVIDIMQRLRNEGHRVVVLSNTNRLHWQLLAADITLKWPPPIISICRKISACANRKPTSTSSAGRGKHRCRRRGVL